jgi:hypothetical protein
MKLLISLISLLLLSTKIFAAPHFIHGLKYSNDKTDSTILYTKALLPDAESFNGGFNKLLPYVSLSPYQQGAGSCLFMSHTGAVELLLGQRLKKKVKLSERYFMNLEKAGIGEELMKNWRTDTILRLNATKKFYLNKDFKFGKGFYKTSNNKRIYSDQNDPKASYGTKWNWVVDLESLEKPSITPIHLPYMGRIVLFADPAQNQWNVGTAPKNIVKKVTMAIKKKMAPVEVIYNHHGFWHAVLIVGYNKKANSHGCAFVSEFQERMNSRAQEIKNAAMKLPAGESRDKKLKKARNFQRKGKKVNDKFLADGGCSNKGVFYVRDSIYPSEKQALYDFDSTRTGEETRLNEPVILRSFEWLEQLSNNIVQIYMH